MPITRISLKNFRCFKQALFDITHGDKPGVTIVQGSNGSGKTSLLEALHYGSHLRSFRTHVPAELYYDNPQESAGFTIQIATATDTLFIGVAGKKRIIKVNGASINTYDELMKIYKVVTFIEDDLLCIKGYPETRRLFIDNAISVHEPHYHNLLRSLRKILIQRTKLLQDHPFHQDQYDIWTDQLMNVSQQIVRYRKEYLTQLSLQIAEITKLYDTAATQSFLTINYLEKRSLITPDDQKHLLEDELRAQRTLYGPHLDDIEFLVYERNSRNFASRGQQKLAIMLLKIAQARLLLKRSSDNLITFLIDDFITDFDETRVCKLLALLFELKVQLIITTPQPNHLLSSLCQNNGNFNLINLDSNDLVAIIPNNKLSNNPEISA
ncbi:MAG: DNA replication and repair protein RecF [Candidatus Babeliaceae bacterium]|nr:DNA replication and repair protein RecF [Candidatus Babeliaceae bacterium]